MSLQNKLMSVGQPSAMAQQTAGDVAAALTATGTAQADALPLSCAYNYVTTVGSGTGVRLYGQSARPSSIGDEQTVYNAGANALNIYPPVGEQILGVAANAAFSVPTSSKLTFKKVTNTLWVASETFVQSGTGAVSTDLQTRDRQIVYVTDFAANGTSGAKVDTTGVTESSSGIQAAINSLSTAAPNPGGVVVFPPGQYKCNAAGLTVPNGVTLVGSANGGQQTNQQGSAVIDFTGVALGISSTSTFGIAIKNLTLKNATTACIKLSGVQYYLIENVSIIGSSVPTGIWLTSATYFGTIKQPMINGLSGVGAIGLKVDGGSNECFVEGGSIKQNTTQISIDNSNGFRAIGVDMEGSNTQTGVSVAPTASADAVIIGCRFETLLNGILLGTNTVMLCAMGNWYGTGTTNGIVDNSTNHRLFVFEPHIYTCTTPGVNFLQTHDSSGTGAKLGSTTIRNISGGVEIANASGKLLLSTTGGNAVQIATNAPLTFQTDNSMSIGAFGATRPKNIFVGSTVFTTAPATETGATRTILATDNTVIANRAGTVTLTLPAVATSTGRTLRFVTIQAQTVVSDASNVVPLAGGSAGTAILAATAGKWADLECDGSNWIITASN